MEKYEKISTIGKGTFGAVYLVRNRENNRQYAQKQVLLDERSRYRTKLAVLSEAKILSQLKHPNIVAYYDSFFDDDEEYLYIIQDYCDGGTMDEKIHSAAQKKEYFEEKQIMQWFLQIALAVQYMHSQKILHRDLKAQNVFLKKKGNTCKLGDFGISKRMSATMDVAQTCVGTPSYLAPEMCQDIPYSSKADVWALGCLLYEMCALRPPFDAGNLISLIFKICKSTPDPIPTRYSSGLTLLNEELLNKNPDERPSARQLLGLPYVKEMLSMFIKENQSALDIALTSGSASPMHPRNVAEEEDLSSTLTLMNIDELKSLTEARSRSKLVTKEVTLRNSNHGDGPTSSSKHDSDSSSPSDRANSSPIYACPTCGLAFRLKPALNKHISIRHQKADVVDATEVTAAAEVCDYEDDFETDDRSNTSFTESDDECESESNESPERFRVKVAEVDDEYCDDFEEYSSDQELGDVVSRAKEFQQRGWSTVDDATIIDDDGPMDIKLLLQPHCEAAVGKEKFEALKRRGASGVNPLRSSAIVRMAGSDHMETCYFIEELYGFNDDDDSKT